jgi:hypothetical protein
MFKPDHEDTEYNQGKYILTMLGLQKYEGNLKKGLLTDNTIMLWNERWGEGTGGWVVVGVVQQVQLWVQRWVQWWVLQQQEVQQQQVQQQEAAGAAGAAAAGGAAAAAAAAAAAGSIKAIHQHPPSSRAAGPLCPATTLDHPEA